MATAEFSGFGQNNMLDSSLYYYYLLPQNETYNYNNNLLNNIKYNLKAPKEEYLEAPKEEYLEAPKKEYLEAPKKEYSENNKKLFLLRPFATAVASPSIIYSKDDNDNNNKSLSSDEIYNIKRCCKLCNKADITCLASCVNCEGYNLIKNDNDEFENNNYYNNNRKFDDTSQVIWNRVPPEIIAELMQQQQNKIDDDNNNKDLLNRAKMEQSIQQTFYQYKVLAPLSIPPDTIKNTNYKYKSNDSKFENTKKKYKTSNSPKQENILHATTNNKKLQTKTNKNDDYNINHKIDYINFNNDNIVNNNDFVTTAAFDYKDGDSAKIQFTDGSTTNFQMSTDLGNSVSYPKLTSLNARYRLPPFLFRSPSLLYSSQRHTLRGPSLFLNNNNFGLKFCCTDCSNGDWNCLANCDSANCQLKSTCENAGRGAYAAACYESCPPQSDELTGLALFRNHLLSEKFCRDSCIRTVRNLCSVNKCEEFGCKVDTCSILAVEKCGSF